MIWTCIKKLFWSPLRGRVHLFKRSFFEKLGVPSAHWAMIGGLTGEKIIILKRICVIVYMITMFYVFLCLNTHCSHSSLLSPCFVVPLFGLHPLGLFIRVPGSKGAAAARGCLASWGFYLWPLCYSTQFNTAKWVKTPQRRAGRINEGTCLEFSCSASSSYRKHGELL